jgi:hypothetical protein
LLLTFLKDSNALTWGKLAFVARRKAFGTPFLKSALPPSPFRGGEKDILGGIAAPRGGCDPPSTGKLYKPRDFKKVLRRSVSGLVKIGEIGYHGMEQKF